MTVTHADWLVRTDDNEIIMEHVTFDRWVKISFRRTIRVPDNANTSALPPDLGKFPLLKMRDYAARVPEPMAVKGGLFFPMHQREAMWINFSATGPFAIKIFAGDINCISGEHRSSPLAESQPYPKAHQDYVVVPGQQWIDGIAVSHGIVKQFIAMPMGSGYSMEAQLTGAEVQGGLQFEITPCDPSRLRLSLGAPGAITVKTLAGKKVLVPWAPDSTTSTLKMHIQDREGIPPDQQRLVYGGNQLEDDVTVGDYGVRAGVVIHLVLRLRGGGTQQMEAQAMSLASGGRVKQVIHHDTIDPQVWDRDATAAVRVQILDPATFRRVTGKAPPPCLIGAKEYADAGLPFFDLPDERPSQGVAGDFGAVKSVNEIDQERGLAVGTEEDVQPLVVDIGSTTTSTTATRYNVPELVIDEEGLLNPDGPFGIFKTITELEEKLKELGICDA